MELAYLNQSQAGQHRFFSSTVTHSCLQFSWVDHTGTWHVLRCPGLVFLSCFCPCPDEGATFLQCLPKAGPCPGRSVHCIGCWGSCFPRPSDLPEGGAFQCVWSEQTPPSLSGYSQKFPPPLVSTCWWLTLSPLLPLVWMLTWRGSYGSSPATPMLELLGVASCVPICCRCYPWVLVLPSWFRESFGRFEI